MKKKKQIEEIQNRVDSHAERISNLIRKTKDIESEVLNLRTREVERNNGFLNYCTASEPISTGQRMEDVVNLVTNAVTKRLGNDRVKLYPTGTNAELRNVIARLQKRLKQVTEFNVMDDGYVMTKDEAIRRLSNELSRQEERNEILRAKVAELKDRLAAPTADVTGYEDAFIDGAKYMVNNAPFSYAANDSDLRSLYHDRAVQRAVFPDVINGETYSMRIVATGELTEQDKATNNDAI